ncbi:MAG TPA: TIGR03118 family protein [Mucilaginibacter sp.]|jgi:uncharacterized protein (TIGR03118 family)
MKNLFNYRSLLTGFIIITLFWACKKDHTPPKLFNISQTNLVADTVGFGAAKIDPNLANAWGIAAAPSGPIWISANHTGLSPIYDTTGKTLRAPIIVPSATPGEGGAPTGQIFNSTTDFNGAKFIFAGEDGTISSWAGGNAATIVADKSQTRAIYKGLTMASDNGSNFLYVANFKGRKIDVFDKNFNYVTDKPFADALIPSDFGPFNIQNINGELYVTYAKLKAPDNEDDDSGLGHGFVDIYSTNGTMLKRFASLGSLNSPWGVALAPAGFCNDKQTILIGNFGDGRINIFDMQGNYKGQLQNNGHVISIDGLWAIDFLKNNKPGGNPNGPLYFTAGPADESHGLFGALQKH